MTAARAIVFSIIAGVVISACLLDSSGFTGGAPDAGPDALPAALDAQSTVPEAAATIQDAGADANFFHPATATLWPTNGHYYEVIAVNDVDWDVANSAASARGGHLATITSRDENLFVWYLVTQLDPPPILNGYAGPWIGGRQADGGEEPDGGWGWVTGESFAYANWFNANQPGGEPNDDLHNENVIGYLNGPAWADYQESAGGPGYIVEYEP